MNCAVCGRQESLGSARLLSSRMRTYRCKSCGVKATHLYRELGKWPTPAFNELPMEERKNFMRSLDGLSSKAAVARVRDRLERYEVCDESFQEGGEFLPLPGWSMRGFDAESIREKMADEDRRVHPLFGATLRLRHLTQVASARRGTKRAVEISASSRGPSSPSGSQQVGGVESLCCEHDSELTY